MNKIKAILFALALGALTPACGGPAGDFCDAFCDCEGCSDREYDSCIVNTEAAIDKAYEYECVDEWDDLEACVLDSADCDGDDFQYDVDCLDDIGDASVCVFDRSDGRAGLLVGFPFGGI